MLALGICDPGEVAGEPGKTGGRICGPIGGTPGAAWDGAGLEAGAVGAVAAGEGPAVWACTGIVPSATPTASPLIAARLAISLRGLSNVQQNADTRVPSPDSSCFFPSVECLGSSVDASRQLAINFSDREASRERSEIIGDLMLVWKILHIPRILDKGLIFPFGQDISPDNGHKQSPRYRS
ncbi:Flagellar hook-associated protein flgK [Chelatococcus asaccharovorans]|nr:Flagellar hook-associated protein flgK [Chelatococcus asaccharovorans]